MFRIVLAVLVAGVVAAIVAIATEPVAAVGAPEPNRISKGDRLDARSCEGRSIQQGTSWSPRQRPRIRVAPPQPRGEVRIASFSLRLAEEVAT